jgi:hypothetical protein
MKEGKIVCSGKSNLGSVVDRKGYDWLSGTGLGSCLIEDINKKKLQTLKNSVF